MVDEVKMKKIERRLDELHNFINQYLDKGIHIPEEIRVEHRELTGEYEKMLTKLYQNKAKEFLDEISKEQPF